MSSLLDKIQKPANLRQLPESSLRSVADDLHTFVLDSVSRTGGHLASGLGVVELTVALHYVYNTPHDQLVWDVGHQSYPHKVLTGRRERMDSIRKQDGLAGFPKREESEFDTFGVGHSSTSISAALGMAIAARQSGIPRKSVAIIGDGSMTAGMAFEALNHGGDTGEDVLVILNDNNMSISPNVGGLSNYMARVLSSELYTSVREESKKVLKHLPPMHEFARRAEEHMKGMVMPGTLFEELGFNYIGPIDGHNIELLVHTLRNIRKQPGPKLLHVITKKGNGYKLAEKEPIRYHGVSSFDPTHGIKPSPPSGKTYTEVFSDWLCDQAQADPKLVGITPAMREGSGLVEFSQRFPDRYHDVAIAEQHAVTLAAGMACGGLNPVVAIYSTFLQRAYDQLIHDVALQNLPVMFAIDRAGLVGPDGPTHSGTFDLSYLRCIPNMVIMTPSDEAETRQMLSTGHAHDGPSAVRYPRGKGTGAVIENNLETLPIGKALPVRTGVDIAILVFGTLLPEALIAAEQLNATVINMRFAKPLDTKLLLELSEQHDAFVTLEDGSIAGGAGSGVAEFFNSANIIKPFLHLGLPDRFQEHGTREQLLEDAGLHPEGIRDSIIQHFATLNCNKNAAQLAS